MDRRSPLLVYREPFLPDVFGALYISEVQKEDALSTYRCITKHKYSGETRQSNGARLSVMDPTESTPSVLDSFQSGEVQVGRNVELPCIASGYPNPTIRWLKDGRPLPADSRWTRRLTGLTVSDLRLGDSGNYICEVTNSFGSKEVTGHLNVIASPQTLSEMSLILISWDTSLPFLPAPLRSSRSPCRAWP
ncbi:cell adhesion molecule DSCAML1-like, partial [Salvelinus sp. IW2-2015]|uniref:cell adhesion molecule DSCAML1-like n=1 Tax=Salvelinus sp. IW2-2015 TaxID=2691554 RepID=UPI000CEAEA12